VESKIKCKYCGYTWNTKSKAILVTCPNCGNKNKVKTIKQYKKEVKIKKRW